MNTYIAICKQLLASRKARRDVYQAIADPTGRAIINLIAVQPHNLNSIAEKISVERFHYNAV